MRRRVSVWVRVLWSSAPWNRRVRYCGLETWPAAPASSRPRSWAAACCLATVSPGRLRRGEGAWPPLHAAAAASLGGGARVAARSAKSLPVCSARSASATASLPPARARSETPPATAPPAALHGGAPWRKRFHHRGGKQLAHANFSNDIITVAHHMFILTVSAGSGRPRSS